MDDKSSSLMFNVRFALDDVMDMWINGVNIDHIELSTR